MNRRSRKTREEITHAFLELLNKKPLRSITVKEVAENADVTRATFYSHYNDIYDLLEQARQEAIEYVVSILDRSFPAGDIRAFTAELFSFFENKEETFALILGENGDMSFLVSALHELQERKSALLKEYQGEPVTAEKDTYLDYQFLFLSGGVLHILTDWLNQENRPPVAEIAETTARLIEDTCRFDLVDSPVQV